MLFAAIDLSVMLVYAAAGSRATRLLRNQGALWLARICGGTLLALAGVLATVRRQA